MVKQIPALDIEARKTSDRQSEDRHGGGGASGLQQGSDRGACGICRDRHLTFRFAPTLFQALTTNVEVDVVGGIPLIEVKAHARLTGGGK